MKEAIKRLKNKGSIVALVGLIVSILINLGVSVEHETVNNVVDLTCQILIILGILNNSTTDGLDNPFLKKGEN